MNQKTANFDPAHRRAAVRRTAVILAIAALIVFLLFFAQALSH